MAGRLREPCGPSAFFVVCTVVEPADSRKRDDSDAHNARLQGSVEVAVEKSRRAQDFRGLAKDEHLGMGGWICGLNDAISITGNDVPLARDDYCADGNLPTHKGASGLFQCSLHEYRHSAILAKTVMERKMKKERIAKHLARLGTGSRRDVERWIFEGRVCVDGVQLETPAINVGEEQKITLDGVVMGKKPPTRLWRYHKPRGLITTHRDTHGRKTVFQSLPKNLPRVVSIGRLDMESEGLLLLTNNGELARSLELPASGWKRCYRVFVKETLTKRGLDRLNQGMEIQGIRYSCRASVEKSNSGDIRLLITLLEGKNRQIRRMLQHIDLSVERLIRLSHGPFELDGLAPGDVREVSAAVIKQFNHAH